MLRPDGLYLVNCVDRPPLTLARAEAATLAAALGPVLVIAEPGVLRGRRYGNVVLAAGRGDLDLATLGRALRTLPVPARLLDPDDAVAFARSAAPIEDTAPARSGRLRRERGRTRGGCGLVVGSGRVAQSGRTFSACGPLGPWVISNSTRWASSSVR